jgi:acetylornithine/succinyldiaminopimelate/putrescine aminotransferase
VNQGHCHPRVLRALTEQAARLTLTSRAFHNDQFGLFYEELCTPTRSHRALPMNPGAEAVESALKVARKWAYKHKGMPPDQAEIIVCADNFHGRTLSVGSHDAALGVLKPCEHGSTFGGNPLACAVVREALRVLLGEDMVGNAERMSVRMLAGPAPDRWWRRARGSRTGVMIAMELHLEAGGAPILRGAAAARPVVQGSPHPHDSHRAAAGDRGRHGGLGGGAVRRRCRGRLTPR